LLRRRDLDVLEEDRLRRGRAHTTGDEPEAPNLRAVLLQQTPHALDRRAGVIARTVSDNLHHHDQRQLFFLTAHRLFGVLRSFDDLDARLLPKPVHQRRGRLHADDRDAHLLGFALPIGDAVHHEPDDDRSDRHAEDDRPQRAAIAQRVLELLPDDDCDLPEAPREVHSRTPRSVLASATNASSRLS
jgi:hypothetical protein